MEDLRKIKSILANPQLLTRIYFGTGIQMCDASTASNENLLKALDNSVIIGEEAIIQEYQGTKEIPLPATQVIAAQSLQGKPIVMRHLQEEVNDNIPSNQVEEPHSSLEIILIKDTCHEQFNIQELFQKSPQNCERQHEDSTYFEELSQKLQRISTEPDGEAHDDEDLSVEDATKAVLLANHLVLQQLKEVYMKALKKDVAKATQKVWGEYEERLQQVQSDNATLKTKMDKQNGQLSQYKDMLKKAHTREEEYHSEIEATNQTNKKLMAELQMFEAVQV